MPSGLRWRIVVSFVLAIACFSASTVYTESLSHDIDTTSLSIAHNAMPSIEQLTDSRAELRRLDSALTRYVTRRSPSDRAEIEDARSRLDEGFERYLTLPVYPGEEQLRAPLHHSLTLVNRITDRILAGDTPPSSDVLATVRGAADVMRAAVDFNAEQGRQLAVRIERDHDRSTRAAIILDLLSALFTAVAAWLALRALNQHHRVVEERNRLVARRAEELELFADRVAHDVLGPLSATRLAVEFVAAQSEDANVRRTLERGKSGIVRVAAIVDGLLRFARAGARPEPGAITQIGPVLQAVVSDLQPLAASEGIKLTADDVTPCSVWGHDGVIASVIENLTRNAIKYMGDRPRKEITLHVQCKDDRVRLEVQDTGPGIPATLVHTLFDPHVRGRTHGQPGIGLGLATVRRVVEAHGGRVGVHSRVDEGSTFWVELPRADYAVGPDDSREKRASAQAGK